MNQDQSADTDQKAQTAKKQPPDDQGNILIDGFIKIFDPNTKEVLVEVRE